VPLRTRTGAGTGLHYERRTIVVFVLIRACIIVFAMIMSSYSIVMELRATSRGVDDSDGESRRR
jgi:hypothetical protein